MQHRRDRDISTAFGSDELLTHLAAEPPSPTTVIVARGAPGTGKTRLLAQLHEQLRDRSILVPQAVDAEGAAESLLVAVADAPAIREREPQLVERIADPEILFEEKVRLAGQALERHAEDFILLGDAAASWLATSRDNPTGNARATLFAHTILRSSCARVFTSPVNERELSDGPVVFELLPHRLDGDAHVSRDWGVLSDEADRAARRLDGEQVTPVAFRMLVLFELVGLQTPPRNPDRTMISLLFWTMERSSDERPRKLVKAWRSLAAVRGLADEALVRDVVAPDDWTRNALRCLLVDLDIDKPRLPELFRWQARRAQNDIHPATIAVHRRAATHYATVDSTLRSRVELVHHLGRALEIDALLEVELLFPEQLHDIGWFLSSRLRRYREAARVYEAVIACDENDAHAHHYRAFNLDIAGVAPAEVQRSYEAALRLQPEMVWWHSRFIRFLITRGRIDEARQAWEKALDSTLDLADATSRWLYDDLHLDVARALLVRNELAFARQVLEDVPAEVLRAAPELAAALHYALRLAHASPSSDYLPIWRLTADWTQRPPALLEIEHEGDRLREWWAGRVHDVEPDDGVAHLLVAKVDADRGEITEEASLRVELGLLIGHAGGNIQIEPGAYLQIGFYGEDEQHPVVVRDERPEDFLDPVPGVFPSPARYSREYVRVARDRQQLV